MSFVFKLKSESVAVVVATSVSSQEVEITSEKEVFNLEEGEDREKFRMVIRRMANEIWVESVSCVGRRPQLARSVETSESARKVEGRCQCCMGFGVTGQGRKKHVAKKSCSESLKREQEVLVLAEELKSRRKRG